MCAELCPCVPTLGGREGHEHCRPVGAHRQRGKCLLPRPDINNAANSFAGFGWAKFIINPGIPQVVVVPAGNYETSRRNGAIGIRPCDDFCRDFTVRSVRQDCLWPVRFQTVVCCICRLWPVVTYII